MKILKPLLLLFLALYTTSSCKAQFTGQSMWIVPGTSGHSENQWFVFRKSYSIQEPLKAKLAANISADSKYWLYINGELVVFEGQLKRGPTPIDTYYDEVDITKYIKQGDNTIAVLLWFWGRDGFCHKNSGSAGLIFEAINSQVCWRTDNTWKYARHSAFGSTDEPFPNYRLPEFNIHYTADSKWDEWMRPGYNESDFSYASEAGPAGCNPWNSLWKRPFPQWKNSGIVSYTNDLSMPFVTDGKPVIMKLPLNYSVTPAFKIESDEPGLTIDIRTDNYKGGGELNVRTEYITRKGLQEFETFGYMNGHEVIYSFPAGIKVHSLGYRRTSFPTEHQGSFVCSDEFLNVLWKKSLNTMDLNMRDAIQDPDRERSQWWGDAVIILGEIFYTCDSNGVKAIKKSISNLVEWQRPDGALYSPVPSGNWFGELPQQMLASIGKYGFWNYYRFSGDTAMLSCVYPHVAKYLSLWNIDKEGLVVHRPETSDKSPANFFWDWTDWGKNIDAPLCENAWFYMALESAAEMSDVLGYTSQAKNYRDQMHVLKDAYNKTFWTGKTYRSPGYTGITDDRGNGLAVVSGIADELKWPSIRALLDTTFLAGPYLEKYILESYFLMNDAKAGIARMKNRYDKMVESPITTLWEGWDIGDPEYGGGTYNHGWSGGPLTLMSQYIAGVQPGNDGFSTILIKPQLGDLEAVDCIVPHRFGLIKVKLRKSGNGKLTAEITLPPGMKGNLQWGEKVSGIKEGFQKLEI